MEAVKSELNWDNTFLPKNEHSVCDDYSSIKVKTEYEYIETNELDTNSVKQLSSSYGNLKCKEEIYEEVYSDSNTFLTEYEENLEEFSEYSETDQKIDISEITLKSSEYNFQGELKSESDCKLQKAFIQRTSPEDDILKQGKEKKHRSTMRGNSVNNRRGKIENCQFCNKPFTNKGSLDDHILKQHQQEAEDDLKSLITSKIYSCNICNSYKSTKKTNVDRHINSVHNAERFKIKCQFCAEIFMRKQSLDGHVLRKHKDKIKNDMNKLITSKFHKCKICNYYTTNKSDFDRHINCVHNKVRFKIQCQFCTELFAVKQSLDGHVLKMHRDEIKDDIKSFITSKIYVCKICNSYETTHTSSLDWHINSVHNEVKIKMKCQFCSESFRGKQSLDGHILRMHKDQIKNDIKSFVKSKIHVCKICNSYQTTKKAGLERHINSVHNKVKIKVKCEFCTESFLLKSSLDEHVLRIHKDKFKDHINRFRTRNCPFCTEIFIRKQSLEGHMLKKHKDQIKHDIKSFITNKIYVCTICNSYETMKRVALDQHINSAHNEVKVTMKCQFCTESFLLKRSLDGHIFRKHKDKINNNNIMITTKIHVCKICNYDTTNKSYLDRHVNSVHNGVKTKIKCEFCTELFVRKHSLDEHVLRVHTDKIEGDVKNFITTKMFVCTICNSYKTTKKSNLVRHTNSVHNEVKTKIKCEFCAKSFLLKRSLEGHVLRKHKDKIKNDINVLITSKIHACDVCDYETTKKSDLDRHINSAHNEVKIKMKCHFCPELFLRKQSLGGHVLKMHRDQVKNDIKSFVTSKIYVCKICNSYETTHTSSLDSHMNSVHNETKSNITCQFCAQSLKGKQALDGHILRKHKDEIKDDIKSFITSKIHVCKICNTYETTKKAGLERHINSVHNKVKMEVK